MQCLFMLSFIIYYFTFLAYFSVLIVLSYVFMLLVLVTLLLVLYSIRSAHYVILFKCMQPFLDFNLLILESLGLGFIFFAVLRILEFLTFIVWFFIVKSKIRFYYIYFIFFSCIWWLKFFVLFNVYAYLCIYDTVYLNYIYLGHLSYILYYKYLLFLKNYQI